MENNTANRAPLLPRDAAYLGRPTVYLTCDDCQAMGDGDCTCDGTGGVFCQLCDARDLTTLAIVVDGVPLCAEHAGEYGSPIPVAIEDDRTTPVGHVTDAQMLAEFRGSR